MQSENYNFRLICTESYVVAGTQEIYSKKVNTKIKNKSIEYTVVQYNISHWFQEFFVERSFRIFDKDGSGTVSLAEFIETMHQFSGQGEDEKISFLFKVYDLNGEYIL